MHPDRCREPHSDARVEAHPVRVALHSTLGVGIAVAFVAIVQHTVGLDAVWTAWAQLPAWAWPPVLTLLTLSYVLRAERLRAHLGAHSRTPRRLPRVPLYLITLRHNLLNLALPMRLGEWSLPVLLRERFRIPLAEGSAGLVWLRLLDLHAVSGIAGLAFVVLAGLIAFDVGDAQRWWLDMLAGVTGHEPRVATHDASRLAAQAPLLIAAVAIGAWWFGLGLIRRLPAWIATPEPHSTGAETARPSPADAPPTHALPGRRKPRWAAALAARCAAGLPAADDRRALRAAYLWTIANWWVKLAALALLAAALLWGLGVGAVWSWPTAILVALIAVIAAELTSVLPIHAPFGLGTYAAGLWLVLAAAGLPGDVALIAAAATHLAFFGVSGVLGVLAFLWPLGTAGGDARGS